MVTNKDSQFNPNMESAAKGYLKHEKAILLTTSARKAVDSAKFLNLGKIGKASDALSTLIPKLQVLVKA